MILTGWDHLSVLGGSLPVQAPQIHRSAPGTETAFCPLASLFIITVMQPGFIMFLFEIAKFLASSDTDVHFNSSHSALACHNIIYQPLHPEVMSANKLVPERSQDFETFSSCLGVQHVPFICWILFWFWIWIGTENPQLLGAAPVSHFLCFPI